jgi:serine/threonine protein kinase
VQDCTALLYVFSACNDTTKAYSLYSRRVMVCEPVRRCESELHSSMTRSDMSISSKYLKGELLGEGTWGSVFSAERRADSLKVAIKRIKPMYVHLGMNFTALREIKYLKYIKGENIIDVRKVSSTGSVLLHIKWICTFRWLMYS